MEEGREAWARLASRHWTVGGVWWDGVSHGVVGREVLPAPFGVGEAPAELVDDGAGEAEGGFSSPLKEGLETRAVGGGQVGEVLSRKGWASLAVSLPIVPTHVTSLGRWKA